MPDPTDLTSVIEQAASEPASVTTEAGSLAQRSLSELIETQKFLAEQAAVTNRADRGLRVTKLVPPGTV